ncbi:MAG: hypothetical protein QXG39_05055 [Candidatus Aenigmatarchaeota archaeon]
MKDPRLSILNLLKEYWSLASPNKEDIVWAVTPLNTEIDVPQICVTDADVDHKLIASKIYQVTHKMKIGAYVKGVENQKQKYEMKEEIRRIIANYPKEAADIDFIFLGEDWKDSDDLTLKPPLLGVEGIVTAVYFIIKS